MIIKTVAIIAVAVFSLVHAEDLANPKPLGKEAKSTRERREDRTKGHLLNEPLFTTAKNKNETSGIGVNTYLWKASLETIASLPKSSVDPFGGILITEWYSFPESPDERIKVEIVITGRSLKSDGVKVAIFRERKNKKGEWVVAPVDPETIFKFEETILSRAREFKVSEEIA